MCGVALRSELSFVCVFGFVSVCWLLLFFSLMGVMMPFKLLTHIPYMHNRLLCIYSISNVSPSEQIIEGIHHPESAETRSGFLRLAVLNCLRASPCLCLVYYVYCKYGAVFVACAWECLLYLRGALQRAGVPTITYTKY